MSSSSDPIASWRNREAANTISRLMQGLNSAFDSSMAEVKKFRRKFIFYFWSFEISANILRNEK